MSAEMAKMMAGVQEAVGKVASTPVAKAAHTAAKPFASLWIRLYSTAMLLHKKS